MLFYWVIGIFAFVLISIILFFALRIYKRSTHVKVQIIYPDRRSKVYWVKPKDKELHVKGCVYFANKDNILLSKFNTPLFIFNYNNVGSIDPTTIKASTITPQDVGTAINANVAKQIFDASQGINSDIIIMLLSGLCLVGLLVLGYLFNSKIQGLETTINEIREILKQISGR